MLMTHPQLPAGAREEQVNALTSFGKGVPSPRQRLQKAHAHRLRVLAWPPPKTKTIRMRVRTIILAILVVAVAFIGATLAFDRLWPTSLEPGRPALVAVPPLQPLTGTSTVLTPAIIAMPAIRDALDAQTPRDVSGKARNPSPQILSNADLNYTITRGPLDVAGRSDALVVTAPLSGTFQVRGQFSGTARAIGGALSSLIGGNIGRGVDNLVGKPIDQRADIGGTVTVTARPTIAPNWRLAPNLSAQINLADVEMPIAGVKLSVAHEVQPFLDQTVREQTNALDRRLRNDPFIEQAARGQWAKLCRAISLGAAGPGAPKLWLEMRPTRAIAAQPKIDANAVTLLVGVEAQTRIVPNETKPDCPFPQQLDIVPQTNEGSFDIAVPIDMPLTEVSRLIEAQLAGRTFPEDGSGPFAITIKRAVVAASGDRLLISLVVDAKKRGLFSIGSDATVHVWGRPVLDQDRQVLRFADVALDVQSQAAFGLLGDAAQAAAPYLQSMLAEKAIIDLKPLAADAKKRMAAAVGDFTKQDGGLAATVTVNDLRLVGIAYDETTLRVIADAKGSVGVTISSLATH